LKESRSCFQKKGTEKNIIKRAKKKSSSSSINDKMPEKISVDAYRIQKKEKRFGGNLRLVDDRTDVQLKKDQENKQACSTRGPRKNVDGSQ